MPPNGSNVNEVIGAALSVPLNVVFGVVDLLIQRGVISRDEMASVLRNLIDRSRGQIEIPEWVTEMLESALRLYE
jgi:hypothetical protein